MSDERSPPGAIVVDARGYRCPVPSLRLRRALEICPDGGEVELLADDPLARIDVPHLVNALGYQVVLTAVDDQHLRFTIRKTVDSTQVASTPSS